MRSRKGVDTGRAIVAANRWLILLAAADEVTTRHVAVVLTVAHIAAVVAAADRHLEDRLQLAIDRAVTRVANQDTGAATASTALTRCLKFVIIASSRTT